MVLATSYLAVLGGVRRAIVAGTSTQLLHDLRVLLAADSPPLAAPRAAAPLRLLRLRGAGAGGASFSCRARILAREGLAECSHAAHSSTCLRADYLDVGDPWRTLRVVDSFSATNPIGNGCIRTFSFFNDENGWKSRRLSSRPSVGWGVRAISRKKKRRADSTKTYLKARRRTWFSIFTASKMAERLPRTRRRAVDKAEADATIGKPRAETYHCAGVVHGVEALKGPRHNGSVGGKEGSAFGGQRRRLGGR